jgi:hypothetical protein
MPPPLAWFSAAVLAAAGVAFSRRARRRSTTLVGESPAAKEEPKVVFLGGACNPTTWRRDLLMPFLDGLGVSYYNPQVDEWHPDLIAVEREAKEKAKIYFFVVSNQTRGLASMIEVAELVSRAFFSRSNVHVLVMIDDVPARNHVIAGEELTVAAIQDLNRARMYLREIVLLHGGRLFGDMETGMAGLQQLCVELGYCAPTAREN